MVGWFYTDALIYGGGMMGFRDGGDGDSMYLIQLSDGIIECRIILGGTLYQVVAPAGSIVAETWQHIAWIYDGSTIELFINGSSIGSTAATGTFYGTTKPFAIGKSISSAGNFVFKGRTDEISLWDKALSQSDLQDMITNELIGNETGLVSYYKFNQGIPGDDNTFISHLFSEIGTNETDALLNNFALVGDTSNFGGELEAGFQVINFPIIENKIRTEDPFTLEAYSSSGLTVSYTIESGPATVVGDLLTLDGVEGEVVVKASQAGNGTYDPAEDVYASFQVLNETLILPELTLLNPTAGTVRVPTLGPIPIALNASIEFPDVLSIESVEVTINGDNVSLTDHENGRYTGWWTPSAHGNQDIEITGTNNFGYSSVENIAINIVDNSQNVTVEAATDVWLNSDTFSEEVEVTLPSFMGAYQNVTGNLIIECPTGGCDPWDRVSHVQIQAHDGTWHEIIRYLTPYGVACDHQVDLTDFISLLQGTVKFRFALGTQGNGFLYSLNLDYDAGAPAYNYSKVESLWSDTYAFGDLANLQPCETFDINYDNNVDSARIKMVSTGHGWGDLNTGNAAEFHHDIHSVWVDGVSTFEQDNWLDCDPNPDGCQPQNGTWYFNRAGWCPGAIAPWFDFDLGTINTSSEMSLDYKFDEDYVDFCHPNNPDCITGTTCSDCNAGFNPHLIVSSHLISYGNDPIISNEIILGVNDFENGLSDNSFDFTVFPNPTSGKFLVDTQQTALSKISIYNVNGKLIKEINSNVFTTSNAVDISYASKGIYLVKVVNEYGTLTKKIIKK
ncbi:MAG: T9SS type A sorting domain-containing protein [Flavobacteriaceae bacterium]|nr:T9SS type A sorting domain-containing protein [Flavobacteriaceae bacterium]